MAVPKQIFQTFKSKKLPWITKLHIWNMKRKNPEYCYFFYDDNDIQKFITNEFPPEYIESYNKLTIGAAKADFFRYAILYKKRRNLSGYRQRHHKTTERTDKR